MKKPNQPHNKKRLNRILAAILLIPICFYILPKAVFYWSVCRGIQESWGTGGDLLFFEFCPAEAVEEWYETLFWEECAKQDEQLPPNTELLISACTTPVVRGVPGGEVLFVHEKKTGEMYLLDLRTGEKRQLHPNYEGGAFLSSELVWRPGYGGGSDYILDLIDGQKYELVEIGSEFNTILDNGEINPNLFPYFIEAEQVFVSYEHNAIIALAPNFQQNPKRNVYFNQSSFGQGNLPERGELLVKLLNDLQVDYQIINFSIRYAEIPSPTGRYVARDTGIYYAGTDTLLIREYTDTGGVDMNAFEGWYYDESSIILAVGGNHYNTDYPWGRSFSLPTPVLKLNLPKP